MNCGKCFSNISLSSSIPLLFKEGNNICLQCFKKNYSRKYPPIQAKQITKNSDTVCETHQNRKMSIYSIQEDKLYCDKCLVFNTQMKKKTLTEKFIDLNDVQNLKKDIQGKIDIFCSDKQQNTLTNFSSIRSFVQAQKNKALIKCLQNIENQYCLMQEKIKLARKKAISQLFEDIQILDNSFFQHNSFISYYNLVKESKKNINKPLKNKLQALKSLQIAHSESISQMKHICDQFQTLKEKKYFQNQFYINQTSDFQLQLSLSQDGNEEAIQQILQDQMLLDGIQQINFNDSFTIDTISWQKIEQETQMSENRSMMSSIDFSNMKMDKVPKVRSNRSILQIHSIQELQNKKISTHIKQIEACGMNLGQTQAKKLLKHIKQSFITKLNLSFNHLNTNWLLNINRRQCGKYLKQIKIQGNNIDPKNHKIMKKISSLQKEGIKIIF